MAEEGKSQGWWQTLPGVITATGGLLTAITALVVTLNQVGVFGKREAAEKKERVSQEQPAGNTAQTVQPNPGDGDRKTTDVPKSATNVPAVSATPEPSVAPQPSPAGGGYDPRAVLGALKAANIGFSVGEKQILDWLAADDRTYRRIADNSLDILGDKRMNGLAPDIDVIKYHYLELLHRDGNALLPLGEHVNRPLLKQAILMASNEKNGGKLQRFERALAKR
jgi:hypothetical protein